MSLLHDINSLPESSNCYLCKPDLTKITCLSLSGIDIGGVNLNSNVSTFDEFSFDYYKYIDGEETNGYGDLKTEAYLLLENYGYFRITSPPDVLFDGDKEYKSIQSKSIDIEMMYKDLKNFKINTVEPDSQECFEDNMGDNDLPVEYITFYNEENPKLSLLDIVINNYLSGWSIGYIDPYLHKKKTYFSIENTNVYTFLTKDVSQLHQCVFIFDSLNFTISAYACGNFILKDDDGNAITDQNGRAIMQEVDNLGQDTNIYLSYRNLIENVDEVSEDDSVYTVFDVSGGDGLDGLQFVNYGDSKIENLDYFLNGSYLSDEIIDKYKSWRNVREKNREAFIDHSRNYNYYNSLMNDIEARNPSTEIETVWKKCTAEQLERYKRCFDAFVAAIESDKKYSINGKFNIEELKKYPLYFTYLEYQYICENINTAITNLDKNTNNKDDYNTGWETDWDLYGITTLEAKLESYLNKIDVLGMPYLTETSQEYQELLGEKEKSELKMDTNKIRISDIKEKININGDPTGELKELYNKLLSENVNLEKYIYYTLLPQLIEMEKRLESCEVELEWEDLTEDEQNNFKNKNQFKLIRQQYHEIKKTYLSCAEALSQRREEYEIAKRLRDPYQEKRLEILKVVSQKNFMTDDDIVVIDRLRKEKDYTNENIFMGEFDDETNMVDLQLELYYDALEQLVISAQPQVQFSGSVTNLLSLEEFKDWHGSFDNGNFIRLEKGDDIHKLRIVSISLNPFNYQDNNLQITFSNMLKGMQGVSDYMFMTSDSANSASKNSITRGSSNNSNSSGDYELPTAILQYIANSSAMSDRLNNTFIGSLAANEAKFHSLFTDTLIAKMAKIDTAEIKNAFIENGFVKYLESNLVAANEIKTDDLISKIAEITEAQIGSAWIDSAFIKYLSTNMVTSEFSNSVISNTKDATIKNAMIDSISANKLISGSILTNLIDIVSDSGNLAIRDNTMQISDNNRVRIQIGKDATNDYNMYVWDKNGSVMFDALGITEDGIQRQIIRNDMISDTANINAGKLDINSLFSEINGASETLKASKIELDTHGQTLDVAFKTIQTTVDSIEISGTNLLRGTNVNTQLTSNGTWKSGTWRSASGGTGARTRISVNDSPNPNIKYGWQFTQASASSTDIAQDCIPVAVGATYTLSCYARTLNKTSQLRLQCGKSPYPKENYAISTSWQRYSFTFTAGSSDGATDGTTNIYIGYTNGTEGGILQICGEKLEKGSSASDWNAASADINSLVVSQGTAVSVMQGQFASKIWQSDINDITGTIESELSSFKQSVNEFDISLSSLTYAGRNLILNSSGNLATDWDVSGATLTYVNDGMYGQKAISITSPTSATARNYITQTLTNRMGTSDLGIYTLSFWYKADSSNTSSGVGGFLRVANKASAYNDVGNSTSTLTLDGQWHYCTKTIDLSVFNGTNVTSVAIYLFAFKGNVQYSLINLKKSNKDSDWTPAVEDGVSKGNIIAAINLSTEGVAIKGGQIALEGCTTINDGFKVDMLGNVTAKNATFKNVNVIGGDITGTNFIGATGSFTGSINSNTGNLAGWTMANEAIRIDTMTDTFIELSAKDMAVKTSYLYSSVAGDNYSANASLTEGRFTTRSVAKRGGNYIYDDLCLEIFRNTISAPKGLEIHGDVTMTGSMQSQLTNAITAYLTSDVTLTTTNQRLLMSTLSHKAGTAFSISNGYIYSYSSYIKQVEISAVAYLTTGYTQYDSVYLIIKKNDTEIIRTSHRPATTYESIYLLPFIFSVSYGDYFSIEMWNGTGNRGVVAATTGRTYLTIKAVA